MKKKSTLYESPLYQNMRLPLKDPTEIDFDLFQHYVKEDLNHIYCHDSRNMSHVKDNTVSLIITSPPYNVTKNYDTYSDDADLTNYLTYLDMVWRECYRVLRPGGRLIINVAGIGRKPYIPLQSYISTHVIDIGFFMMGEVIWDKSMSAGESTGWGSFCKPSAPTLRDIHEYLLVFCKESAKLNQARSSEISIYDTKEKRNHWATLTKSIQSFATASAKKLQHPAPYPEKLVAWCIELYTYKYDLVVDPFMGSGTTAVVAKKMDRYYIGYDVSEEYVKNANIRVNNTDTLFRPQKRKRKVSFF